MMTKYKMVNNKLVEYTADELKEDLGCDNEYIRKMLIAISEYYV